MPTRMVVLTDHQVTLVEHWVFTPTRKRGYSPTRQKTPIVLKRFGLLCSEGLPTSQPAVLNPLIPKHRCVTTSGPLPTRQRRSHDLAVGALRDRPEQLGVKIERVPQQVLDDALGRLQALLEG